MDERQAKDIMDKIISDYEKLTDSFNEQNLTGSECSQKVDEFCIVTLRSIFSEYYAEKL